MIVGGVGQLVDNAGKLKYCRVLSAKLNLFFADEFVHQRRDTGQQVTLENLQRYEAKDSITDSRLLGFGNHNDVGVFP